MMQLYSDFIPITYALAATGQKWAAQNHYTYIFIFPPDIFNIITYDLQILIFYSYNFLSNGRI